MKAKQQALIFNLANKQLIYNLLNLFSVLVLGGTDMGKVELTQRRLCGYT